MLAFSNYGGFSWPLIVTAALIGLFGFETGLVLKDYVDREKDKKDVEFDRITRHWRPFGSRPLPSGSIAPKNALALFFMLVALTSLLIATLPYTYSLYVFAIMRYSYLVKYGYHIRKRKQKFPLAQILGRTDLALFPVEGYLCYGSSDKTALLLFIFFYPRALAHLGLNDLIDIKKRQSKGHENSYSIV